MHLQVSSNYQKTWENVIKVANEQLEEGQFTVALDAMDLLDFHVQDLFDAWARHHNVAGMRVARFLDSDTERPMYIVTKVVER
jgi:predicted kinase